MKLEVSFAGGEKATANKIEVSHIYAGGIIDVPGKYTKMVDAFLMAAVGKEARRKGSYCLTPELMDEVEVWGGEVDRRYLKNCGKCLKDYKLSCQVGCIYWEGEEGGYYYTRLVWFQSKKELSETPILELVSRAVSSVSFEEVKPYMEIESLEDLLL